MSDLQCAVTVVVVPHADGVATHLWDRLQELADLHRGETVTFAVTPELMRAALGTDEPVTMRGDNDGWVRAT